MNLKRLIPSIFQNNNVRFLNSKTTRTGYSFSGIYEGNSWWNEKGRLLVTIERIVGRGNVSIKEYGKNITVDVKDALSEAQNRKTLLLNENQIRNVINILLNESFGRNTSMAIVMALKVITYNPVLMKKIKHGNEDQAKQEITQMIGPICDSYNSETEIVVDEVIKAIKKN